MPTGSGPLRGGGAATPTRWPSRLGPTSTDHPGSSAPVTSPLAADPSPTAEEDKAAAAAARLQRRYEVYYSFHAAFNHNTAALDQAIKEGVIRDAEKPPGFFCAACARSDPSGAHWQRHTKASTSLPLVPYHAVEIDLWGPLDVKDRNGFRYVFGGVCKATGKGFLQPMRSKSEAAGVLRSYLALIREQCPGIEVHLRKFVKFKEIRVPGLAVVFSDRGGEFTTTFGYTQSEFDSLLRDVVHKLNTPNTPQSGTSRIERMWLSLTTAARSSLLTSGLGMQYFFDAMVLASDVRNCMPTTANRMGDGEAPNETLGLPYDLRTLVPLGTLGYLRVAGNKADAKNALVMIVGLNHDGLGYRAVRVDNGTMVTSVDIKPVPKQSSLRKLVDSSKDSPGAAAAFIREHCDLTDPSRELDLGSVLPAQLKDLTDIPPAVATPPLIQQVGNAPGNGGSRVTLKPRAAPPASAAPSGQARGQSHLDTATVRAMIRDARAAGQVLRWRPGFAKTGKSGERFQFYSKARTFAQFDALSKETFLSGLTGTQRPKAVPSDLNFDAARGIVTFVDADTPVGAASAAPAAADVDAGPAVDSYDDASAGAQPPDLLSDSDSDTDSDEEESDGGAHAPPPPGTGRYLLRSKPYNRAASAVARSPLTSEERDLLHTGFDRTSAYVAVPDSFVKAAVQRHEHVRVPRSIAEAQRSDQWDLWLAALKKEYGGLLSEGVFGEVDATAVPASTKVVPTQVIFEIKRNGTYKCRIVVRGDLTVQGVHYLETKSTMTSLETIRMLVAFAAGSDMPLYSTDFSQAFLNAAVDNPQLYCSLPQLPPEMRGGDFGAGGKRGKVGHLKKALYGLPQAPRLWQQHLMRFLTVELGAKLFITDRDAFEWEWGGERLVGACHVDDILFCVSSLAIRDEFMRRLKATFRVTGGEEEATEFCGLQIVRDWNARTITLTQEAFARKMLAKYDVSGRAEATPLKVSKSKLEPYTGEPCEETSFDYSMALGDLAWYARTNPGLSVAVHKLAQFMQRPGPGHIEAVHHVLRYVQGNLGAGLTYHGSSEVLSQSYDHRSKLIATFDSDFPHTGAKATSGVAVMLNGAAIAWKTRRQTTVSINSTEAEVKAMEPGVQMVRWLTDLWGEFMRQPHGCACS